MDMRHEHYPRIGAPDWDRSPNAEFRRQIAALLREVTEPGAPSGEPGSSGPAAACVDMGNVTPFLVMEAADRLKKRVALPSALAGLPFYWSQLLIEIVRREEATPARLRRASGLARSSLTDATSGFEARGMLERRARPGDRRTFSLVPTPLGRDVAAEAMQRWKDADEDLLVALSPAERDTLRALLRKVIATRP